MSSNETEDPIVINVNVETRDDSMEKIKLKTKKFFATSLFGQMYNRGLLILSVLSGFQFIIQSYFDESHDRGRRILEYFSYLELVLAALFAFDWFLNLFLSDHPSGFFFSFFAMVDFVTVIPIWLTFFVFPTPVRVENVESVFDVFNYILYASHTIRILRVLRLRRRFAYIEDEVKQTLCNIALSITTMIMFDAALMMYLEKERLDLPFHTWVYYLVVTSAAVGYGDIYPLSTLGRAFAVFMILTAVITIPKLTNDLIEKINRYSVYSRAQYDVKGYNKHVVICGALRSTSLQEFFTELFHEDHDSVNLNCVLLQAEAPSREMHQVMKDPLFSLVLHYLVGSPLNDGDLIRCNAHKAVAVFIMEDKFSVNADEEDAKAILQQFSIKRFISAKRVENPIICMQLIKPENRRHVATDASAEEREIIICLNEMKMGVIAKTITFPGFSTLIFNLLCSFADGDEEGGEELEKEESGRKGRGRGGGRRVSKGSSGGKSDKEDSEKDSEKEDSSSDEEKDDKEDDEGDDDSDEEAEGWKVEYKKGCDWEIYMTELSDGFIGKKFIDLAINLHARLGILLFALRIKDLTGKNGSKTLLNPSEYIIPEKDKYQVEGFVLAKNKASSNLFFTTEDDAKSFELANIAASIGTSLEAGMTTVRRQSVALLGGSSHVKNNLNQAGQAKKGWQKLLSSTEVDAEKEHNQQEQLHKIEEEYLKLNFYIMDTRKPLAAATCKLPLLTEHPEIENHLIIMGKGISNLYDLVRPLRYKKLGFLQPICILYPGELPHNIWRRISIFEEIYFVRGSILEESDIRRAGIFRASHVVVLAESVSEDQVSKVGSEALVDADAIFGYQCVRRMNEKAAVIIEIVREQNVRYLEKSTVVSLEGYKFSSQFASGSLFTSSILDTIVCQAFYNPPVMNVLNKLISGTDHTPQQAETKALPFMSARKKKDKAAISGSSVYQLPIPDGLEAKTYGAVMKHFAKEGVLCVGLLRGLLYGLTVGPKGNHTPYVFTNPSKNTEVYSCDRVFVLSQKLISMSKPKMMKRATMNRMSSFAGALQKKHDLVTVDHITSHIHQIIETQKQQDIDLADFNADFNKKIETITVKLLELKQEMRKNVRPGKHGRKIAISRKLIAPARLGNSSVAPMVQGQGQGQGQGPASCTAMMTGSIEEDEKGEEEQAGRRRFDSVDDDPMCRADHEEREWMGESDGSENES